jgi:transcription antitermination protein NusB
MTEPSAESRRQNDPPKSANRGDQPRADGNRPRSRSAPGGRRHQARILALQILFEIDLTNHEPADVLARTFADQPTPPETRRYVERLVKGTLTDQAEIDQYVLAAAPAFPVAQLPSVDRNVLRIAIFELLRQANVPPKVAINEAVELAKRFGGDNSGRFVNGVLGTVVNQIDRANGSADETEEASPSPTSDETAED